MNVSATAAAGAPTADAPAAAPRSEPVATFAKVLEGQQRSATQTIALRDLLASMPPMMAEQIQRSVPGGKPPLDAVDALFKATKSGEFVPDAQQIAARSCLIATTARAGGLPLRGAPDRIRPIPSSAWPQAARRPANSSLDTARLRCTFDLTLPPWQDDVRPVVATLIPQATRE